MPIAMVAAFFLIVLAVVYYNIDKPQTKEQQIFEERIVKALQLKLICRDTTYEHSTRLNIINDTLVGLWSKQINNRMYKYFFIQSMQNPRYKREFNNVKLVLPSISAIDQYRNGCLYFGAFGLSFMQSLCSDGALTDYFKKYNDTLFYANKVMLYKNQAIIASMNGIFVFDILTQQLIWKYKYHSAPMEGRSAVIGNKLIFTETINGFLKISSYNLEKFKIDWLTRIPSESDNLFDGTNLENDGNNLIAPGNNACYTINLHTGDIKGKIPWKKFFSGTDNGPLNKVENGKLYVTNYNNQNDLSCVDVIKNRLIWHFENAKYWGLFKAYILATTPDDGYFLVIDKVSGRLLDKVLRPKSKGANFDLIGKYVFINHHSFYQ